MFKCSDYIDYRKTRLPCLPEVEGVAGFGKLQNGRLAARRRVAIQEVRILTATVTTEYA